MIKDRYVYRYVGERGEQRRLWLMDFIYLYEIKQLGRI
jgi:hypothetical protein